ncbi:MAG: bifunctional 4-hydroxy-2-oxoglutarate aldolase/2-dehydro-3-deoxy-phosphogluconate aldolase [Planctomycetes bacterium]|nr:bifunctional 4-hydroxy-2-oxoglutarate aldolase/2-dehydro-3-deoxy-phosphogluconate aldolase [Planctomycetota bacterium]
MAQHSRLETLTAMKTIGLVPVYYSPDFETAKNIAVACVDGGAKVIEFTNRGDRAIDVFTQLAKFRDAQRSEMILGVGSICDAPTAAMYINAGADFVVGPVLDEETAKLCNSRKIPYSPGCGTVTEIHNAHCLGVDICKIFPGAQVGGPEFVKAVKGPMPWTELMPTGGVIPAKESLTEWFTAGIACAGIGSKLISKELVAAKDYARITEKIAQVIEMIKDVRKKL